MIEPTDEIVNSALEALEAGGSPDEIAARNPETAGDLRPLLQVAAALPSLRRQPLPASQAASRRVFLAQASVLAGVPPRAASPGIRLLARAIGVVVIILGIGVAPVLASAGALPGEPLYGVKRAVEAARLALAPNPALRDTLTRSFDQERINEIRTLMTRRGSAAIEILGVLETLGGDRWQIAGLTLRIDAATRVNGVMVAGAQARVQGRVENGVLIASDITVLGVSPATATIAPMLAPLPTMTDTTSPEATQAPTEPPQAATETPEVEPTGAAQPQASDTPEIGPTETPEPEASTTGEPQSTEGPQSTGEPTNSGGGSDGGGGGGSDGGGGSGL